MGTVWINEIDYDQIGTDSASFIELKSTGTINFADYAVVLVNGSTNTPYLTLDLDAAGVQSIDGLKVVVGNNTILTPIGAMFIQVGTTDFIQNGPPDGIALINVTTGSVVEYWSYEGSMTGTSFAGITGTFDATVMVDGSANILADDNFSTMSLVRADKDTWAIVATPTPGDDDPFFNYVPAVASMSIAATGSGVEDTDQDGYVTFKVTRTDSVGVASATWTVDFTGTADAADFHLGGGTVTFKDGKTSATIKIKVAADALAEANETFSVVLSNATGGVILDSTGTGTILNDDASDASDSVTGNAFANIIDGGLGDDSINGAAGNDTLIGGFGKDVLTGGTGADRFDFNSAWESPFTSLSRDTITDFSRKQGDRIDLSTIDADVKTDGDQSFTIIAGGFTGVAGELRLVEGPQNTVVQGDIDGNGTADFAINVLGFKGMVAADFIL